MVVIMTTFNLQDFLDTPSCEALEKCQKDGLLLIADHFQIPTLRSMRKSEIKQRILECLLELKVLTVLLAVESTSALAEISTDLTSLEGVPGAVTPSATELQVRATLPRYDPISPRSEESVGILQETCY